MHTTMQLAGSRLIHRPKRAFLLSSGFTFVELLVSTVVISIILGGLITFPQIIGRGSQQSRRQNESQAAIDSDLSGLRTLANNFTCCTGTCTVPDPPRCNNQDPGQANFYIPTANSAAETSFKAACNSGTLASSLRTIMNGQSFNTAITSRAIEVDSALAHRLRVTYTAPGNVERLAIVVPTTAAFCPDR
jgi:prepilin-type N-terminal cleavage/methylation domain-containing protein